MQPPKVSEYFKKQPPERQKVLNYLRDLILKTLPGADEDFAWGVPVYEGGKFYLASLKKQVNIGFSIVGLDSEEVKLFEGTGKTARHIKVASIKDVDEKQLVYLIKLVAKKSSCPE